MRELPTPRHLSAYINNNGDLDFIPSPSVRQSDRPGIPLSRRRVCTLRTPVGFLIWRNRIAFMKDKTLETSAVISTENHESGGRDKECGSLAPLSWWRAKVTDAHLLRTPAVDDWPRRTRFVRRHSTRQPPTLSAVPVDFTVVAAPRIAIFYSRLIYNTNDLLHGGRLDHSTRRRCGNCEWVTVDKIRVQNNQTLSQLRISYHDFSF